MQGGVDHDGLALLELHLHLRERREVRPVGITWAGYIAAGRVAIARLHSLTESGRVPSLLAALASHARRQPIEFAVETVAVRGQGGRVAAPGRM